MSKTIVGILIALAGVLGLSNIVTGGEVAQLVDSMISIVGLGVAWYGRYKAVKPITVAGTYSK